MKNQELLLDIIEKLDEIRGRIIDIETAYEKNLEMSITNKGNLYKYPTDRTYEDVMSGKR